jgi:hypothetical protein
MRQRAAAAEKPAAKPIRKTPSGRHHSSGKDATSVAM